MNTAKQTRYAANLSSACMAPSALPSASARMRSAIRHSKPWIRALAAIVGLVLLASCDHKLPPQRGKIVLEASPKSVNFGNVPVGTTAAQSVTVTFQFGANDDELSVDFAGDGFAETNNCPETTEVPGTEGTCTVTVNVSPPAIGPLSGTLTIRLAAATVTVPLTATGVAAAGPVLSMNKTTQTPTYTANGSVQFTLAVTNTGSAATDGTVVTVTDVLDSSLSAFPIAATNWNCNIAGATVTCTRTDALPSGGSYDVIIIQAEVNADPPASITNVATVAGGGAPTGSGSATTTLSP